MIWSWLPSFVLPRSWLACEGRQSVDADEDSTPSCGGRVRWRLGGSTMIGGWRSLSPAAPHTRRVVSRRRRVASANYAMQQERPFENTSAPPGRLIRGGTHHRCAWVQHTTYGPGHLTDHHDHYQLEGAVYVGFFSLHRTPEVTPEVLLYMLLLYVVGRRSAFSYMQSCISMVCTGLRICARVRTHNRMRGGPWRGWCARMLGTLPPVR